MTPETWLAYQRFREQFHAILDENYYPASWLDGEIACGRMVLFTADSSAILVSVKTFPSGLKEVHGEAAVGKHAEIVRILIPRAEKWAKSIGCASASISSRMGWVKMLPDYQIYQTTIRKSL